MEKKEKENKKYLAVTTNIRKIQIILWVLYKTHKTL